MKSIIISHQCPGIPIAITPRQRAQKVWKGFELCSNLSILMSMILSLLILWTTPGWLKTANHTINTFGGRYIRSQCFINQLWCLKSLETKQNDSRIMFQIIRNKMIAGSLRSPPLRQRVSKRGDVFSLLAFTFKGVNLFFLVLVYLFCFRLLSKTLTLFRLFLFQFQGIYQIFSDNHFPFSQITASCWKNILPRY